MQNHRPILPAICFKILRCGWIWKVSFLCDEKVRSKWRQKVGLLCFRSCVVGPCVCWPYKSLPISIWWLIHNEKSRSSQLVRSNIIQTMWHCFKQEKVKAFPVIKQREFKSKFIVKSVRKHLGGGVKGH